MIRRRAAILGGGALAAAAVLAARRLAPQRFDFEPVPGVPGFRRLPVGSLSPGSAVFAGLGAADPDLAQRADMLAQNPCPALFAVTAPGTVPVASFSDYRCAYCRVLTPMLADLARTAPVSVTWHELPLLGPASLAAAKAALAADLQDAYLPTHARLMRTSFLPTPAYLADLARSLDLDPDRFLADLESPAVARRLADAAALARAFAIPGTPALVVGRTLVVGEVSRPRLTALIDLESRTPAPPCG